MKNSIGPPDCALQFFRWFCDPDLHPFIEGDLIELYEERVIEFGKDRADRRFIMDVILLFRPSMIRHFKVFQTFINKSEMLFSYLKVGFRDLLKHKAFSFINVVGMTMGMTCFMLMAFYIQYESSYDTQHENVDRIYRLAQVQPGNDFRGSDRFALAPRPLVPAMMEEFPEVEAGVNLDISYAVFEKDGHIFTQRGLYADEGLFDVFTYSLLEGVGAETLSDPNGIILTREMAKKYFGDQSPIGQTLNFEKDREVVVRGVIEDIPDNQHIQFDFLISVQNLPYYDSDRNAWASNNYSAYVILPQGYDHTELEKKLTVFDSKFASAFEGLPFLPTVFLQPLADLHLHSNINFELGRKGDIRYIYLSASIAFIILLLALINYMNLANARSGRRSKEVGMRKVLGARRRQLINQFLAESTIISLSSFVLAILFSYLLLPAFNHLMDLEIPFSLTTNKMVIISVSVAIILLGALSGLYPAIMCSAVSPIKAFKGNWFNNHRDGSTLRGLLVVGQFTTAIVLAIGSIVVFQQLKYIQDKKLGYNRDQIVFVPYGDPTIYEKSETIKQELTRHPQIDKVALVANMPLNVSSQGIVDTWEGNAGEEELWIYRNYVDYNFFDLFEMELVEGRNFSPEHATDSSRAYVLNESAVQALGWESAVGKAFNDGQVVGVVRDFHFQPFDLAIEPMFIILADQNRSNYGNIAMKLNTYEMTDVLEYIYRTLSGIVPHVAFNHRFMDDSYNQLYDSERRYGKMFNIFTLIALFIACMGLFGLVTHHVLQRTREIGIRKILGASAYNIVRLVSMDFLKLVFISAIISVPIAWWFMSMWLEDFVYHIDLQWWIFLLTGVVAAGIAFFTISSQVLKAALANPSDTLKVER